jgi:hypothetical protein
MASTDGVTSAVSSLWSTRSRSSRRLFLLCQSATDSYLHSSSKKTSCSLSSERGCPAQSLMAMLDFYMRSIAA